MILQSTSDLEGAAVSVGERGRETGSSLSKHGNRMEHVAMINRKCSCVFFG